MRQTTELSRVKALAEQTVSNGCTEAEAMAAAEMVGRLLERYALSMEEIDVREERCIQVEVPIGGKRRRPIDACVTAIAHFCDCKVWVSRDTMMPSYVFFGFNADTAIASYLFNVIDRAMATALTAFRTAQPRLHGVGLRDASRSFQQGMAARVADRLDAMHRERDANVAAQRSTGTALILVKQRGRRSLPGDRDPARGDGRPESRTSERAVPAWTGRRRSRQSQPPGGRRRQALAAVTGDRDRQRSKVYAWEERFVAPRDPSSIAFAQAQGMVNAIWAEMGLLFTPKVEPLPRQARSTVADANRLSIRLADASPSWWLLHELAHAMTSTYDGRSDGHGPKFIGLYAQLLARYLRLPSDALLTSLRLAGIEMDTRAEPIFIDNPQGFEPPPVDQHPRLPPAEGGGRRRGP